MGPHHLRSTGRFPRGVRRTLPACALAAALLLAALVASPALAATAPAPPSPLALATLSPIETPALGASFLSRLVPNDYDTYSVCFDGSPTRLHGPHGLVIIPASAEPEPDGVHWVMAPGPAGEPGAAGILPWKDFRGVDLWKPGAFGSGAKLGGLAGTAAGIAVMSAVLKEPDTFFWGAFEYAGEFVLGCMPFGAAGVWIGQHIGPPDHGHWVRCNR